MPIAAVIQFRPDRGAKDRNLDALVPLCEGALGAGAKLLVLPEMAAVGYRFPDADAVRPLAEAAQGRTCAVFAALARTYGAHVVVGLAEADADGSLYNSALVIDPAGALLHCYRKRMLFDDDFTWAKTGDRPYPVFQTALGTTTVGICMDMNDTRFTGFVRRTAPDCVCFPTNWIDQGRDDIHTYWTYRLYGWPGVLLAADRWGEEDGVRFWGRSAILRDQRVVARAEAEGDGWIGWDAG